VTQREHRDLRVEEGDLPDVAALDVARVLPVLDVVLDATPLDLLQLLHERQVDPLLVDDVAVRHAEDDLPLRLADPLARSAGRSTSVHRQAKGRFCAFDRQSDG